MNMQSRENYVHFETDRVNWKETPNKDIPLNQMFTGSIGYNKDRLFIKLESSGGSWIYAIDAELGATGEYWTRQPAVTDYRPVISLTAKI